MLFQSKTWTKAQVLLVGAVLSPGKQARGIRQILLRGIAKVEREWQFICTGHNLLKLFAALGQNRWQRKTLV